MKRFIYILLCLVFLTAAFPFSALINAEQMPADSPASTISPDDPQAAPEETVSPSEPTGLPTMDPDSDPFDDISTPHLLLMEAESGIVLYDRKGYEKAFPASTTKIMTALLAIENLPDLNKVITIDWHYLLGFGRTSSMMGLVAGEKIALIDVLHGLMMRSGNDAARTLDAETAFAVYGKNENADANAEVNKAVKKFIELMNAKAVELGMNSTHFATVDGRHNEEHYTTAYDFALLMREALKNPTLQKIMSTPVYDVKPDNKQKNGYHLENSNRLICKKASHPEDLRYKYCIGGKTGETNFAGFCLVTAAEKNGVRLILVQFGDNNSALPSAYRFKAAHKIYDWGFKNYVSYPLNAFGIKTEFDAQAADYSPYDEAYGKFTVKAETESLSVEGISGYLDKIKANQAVIKTVLEFNDLTAPIETGDIVGTVSYYFYDGIPITAQLIAQRDIAAISETTPEPHETAFITGTPPPGDDKNCNLNLLRSPGKNEYSVWVYYKNSLYTMDSTQWHYLYCDDTVFRACTSSEQAGNITLYRRFYDTDNNPYYKITDTIDTGSSYVIVSDGKAMCTDRHSGSLRAVDIKIDDNGLIAQDISEKMVWNFKVESNGYHIMNSSKYLSRSAGNGALLWIIIIVLLLTAAVCIHLFTNEKRNRARRRHKRNKKARYYAKMKH